MNCNLLTAFFAIHISWCSFLKNTQPNMGCAPSSERGWTTGEVACGCFGCTTCTGCVRSVGCAGCVDTGDIGCLGCATCVSSGDTCGRGCGGSCGIACTNFCNGCQGTCDTGCALCCGGQGIGPNTVEYGDASSAVPLPEGAWRQEGVVSFWGGSCFNLSVARNLD